MKIPKLSTRKTTTSPNNNMLFPSKTDSFHWTLWDIVNASMNDPENISTGRFTSPLVDILTNKNYDDEVILAVIDKLGEVTDAICLVAFLSGVGNTMLPQEFRERVVGGMKHEILGELAIVEDADESE